LPKLGDEPLQPTVSAVMRERSVRRLAAILSIDVVGYSRLMHEDEEGTLVALKAHRRELIDPKIAEYRGRIVKTTGDGMLLEFPSAVDAVQCAVDLQQDMAHRNAEIPDHRRMLLRAGINLSDVIVDGDDIYGDGVNVAARLETLSSPGCICISGAVYKQLAGKITREIMDMGDQTLKNIEDPVRIYQILVNHADAATTGRQRPAPPDLGFGAPERPSIVILPFKNLSGDPDQDFLAEGLRLGILSSLVQLSGLFLIGTDSVNGLRDQNIPAAQAGAGVNARYVLGGAVQQVGKHLRATLQLTDVATGNIVWSERYDRDVEDLFKVQDEITQEVLLSLDVELVGGENTRIFFDGITRPEAREHYHRGMSHFYAGTKERNATALRHFHDLYRIQQDTDHAASFISLIHLTDAMFGWSPSEERSLDEAAKWASIAIKYETFNGIGHIVTGHLQLLHGSYLEALANCEIALRTRPSCSLTHAISADVRNYSGDPIGAIKNAREALLLERIYPPWLINVLATAYRDSGKVRLSIPAAKEGLRIDPRQTEARIILCSDYSLDDSREEGRQIAQEIIAADPRFRLSTYAEKKPYRNAETLQRLIDVLREAGLPE
jgi:adenylate cyclase